MRVSEQIEVEKFWGCVDKSGECWVWTRARTGLGYGAFYVASTGKTELAHRVSLELSGVTLSNELHVDHLCRNKYCVNPDHLEQVTMHENLRRSPLYNSNRIICSRGHEFNKENTRYRLTGGRACRICENALNSLRRRVKAKAEGRTLKLLPSKRTHCPQGHPYNETNTYVTKEGWRHCKTCDRARDWRLHENHRTNRKHPESFI